MTPNRTRAEQLGKYFGWEPKSEQVREIEQALDEAVREDRKITRDYVSRYAHDFLVREAGWKGEAKGTLAGLEMAAGIADGNDHFCDHPFNPSIEIANEIRAKAKELNEKA